ncbi:MAG: hypothetical protein IJJ83_02510 [Muribaculaceae bacterium]|nr:hypothetical protein [Muribaculaceae bacterium]
MRTPEELHRYGKYVIEKHCPKLFSLDLGSIPPIIDENNQTFSISDYRDWKSDVIDFIKYNDPDRIHEIEHLFQKFEILFTAGDLSKILGLLKSSINDLRRKEKGEGTNNPQKAQETNEPETTGENPPNEKKKKINWKRVWEIIVIIATIIGIVAAIATIIGAVFAALTYYK